MRRGGKKRQVKRRGGPAKAARRKATPARRRTAPGPKTHAAAIARERDEALHQQAATAEVLKLISSSPADTQPVFEAIVRSGLKLFPGAAMFIALPDGDLLRAAAFAATDPVRAKMWQTRWPIPLTREYMHSAAFLDRKILDVPDARKPPPELALGAKNFLPTGYRAVTIVPLMRGRTAIGTLSVVRLAPGKLSARQNAALKTYAAQAVVAIENTRLLNALRQRTDDLAESLEQQTATSEVLEVISRSAGALDPVFNAMLENATRICGAKLGNLFLCEGEHAFRAVAVHGKSSYADWMRRDPVIDLKEHPYAPLSRVRKTKAVVHIPDLRRDESYRKGDPRLISLADTAEARSQVVVPMLKDRELIGALVIYRTEMRPFSEKQIALLTNFAAQAVIAIENARLLNELRQRTDDLSESLEQQTAMSEILEVISNSPTDTQPVFDAIVRSGLNLFPDAVVAISLPDRDLIKLVAMGGADAAGVEALRGRYPMPLSHEFITGTAILDRREIDLADAHEPPKELMVGAQNLLAGGYRAMTVMPMMRGDETIGALNVIRRRPGPLSNKQRGLLRTFASQAVIAIENTRLFSELRESLQQQTATADVLTVISSSPGDLEPVFRAILANATDICGAKFGTLYLSKDGAFQARAFHNAPPAFVNARKDKAIHPSPESTLDRAARTRQVAQVLDATQRDAYRQGDPFVVAGADLGGYRTIMSVPMLKDDELVGVITIYRQEVLPFNDKQVELVKSFAAQAVIAIENARLLNELRESLEQQTATSEVLKVISSSQGELEAVFQTLLANATRICEAAFGSMLQLEGDMFRRVALHNAPPAFAEFHSKAPLVDPRKISDLRRVIETKQLIHVADTAAEHPDAPIAKYAGGRTLLVVPMLKDEELIGAIGIYRQEVRPFTDKQIELVQSFAAQAVIAIENTRLLNELRESLQQQTATADVLKVIAGSSGELDPVFSAVLANATHLCEASYGALWLREGDSFRTAALHGDLPKPYLDQWRSGTLFRPNPDVPMARVAATGQPVQVADLSQSEAYRAGDQLVVTGVDKGGIRTIAAVPMFRDKELIGVFAIYRTEVRLFADKQIELVQNFAAQAVIAIENARLLNELRESLQQQTATADVLKVISRSTFDLQTVLETLVESAARLCDADRTLITRQKDGVFYRAEAYGFSREFMDYVRDIPIVPERGSAFGRALLEGRAVHIPDVKADPDYTSVEMQRLGDFRTVLAVPMVREGTATGVLSLTRTDVRPFSDRQIELASTFADQAAIAIENVRLFESVEARTRELAASLEDLRATQDRLVQTQKLASLGQLTGIAHEIKNPLNFVNNFSAVSSELIDELREAMSGVAADDKTRRQIDEIATLLRGNLDKVVQHGKRADSIVKNMLLHSREGSGEHRPVDINALVEESLNLAYHGARAEKQNFNVTLERSLDPAAGEADIFPQDITRVLLNLILNGFYAANRRKAQAGDGFEPTLAAATRSLGDRVEIRIRDNGTGIPPEVREKMFNPFFTTKPAGEGTGLGLSISHDIVVKQHAGAIEVDTEPGAFTEFRIILPRKGAFAG
jgi:GAF domain-containing protein